MRVFRCALVLAAVLAAASVFGQTSRPPKPAEKEKAVHLTLYPAAEPRPALKYQLLPPFLERRPGNAAVWWNRLPAERNAFFDQVSKQWEESGVIHKWLQMRIGTPQEKAYRKAELSKVIELLRDRGVYSDMQRAARFESCDRELPIREGNYFEILLPEVQYSRMYARLLQAKAHLEIAEGNYDQAVRTLQVGYAEGRDVAQGQTLINSLVGVTIAAMMSHEVEQLIQQPDSPNLYWALSGLPRPLVDFRPGGESEANLLYLEFPELRDVATKKYSADEWNRILQKIVRVTAGMNGQPEGRPATDVATATTLALQGYPKARRGLIERGRSAAEVDAMPVAQAILVYSVQIWNEASDDVFKWYFLPASEVGGNLEQMEQQIKSVFSAEVIPLVRSFLPAAVAAKNAETRGEWNVAMLRVFEAMRLYAASHGGRWPDQLSDITEVPVAKNPFDGKPFLYHRDGDRATLSSEKGPRGVPWKYEISLKQGKK
ncbi:MAG: hypothetical protein LLG00_12020 [Planctomycetaceae bacterium]|nr:hypothetical protein [Planctomycetaceae bacterium]